MLSVVIPSYRRADLLRLCLRTVAAHRPVASEVIVVDDASPGGCVSAAAAEFPFVRVVRLLKQSGFCVAANAGIQASSGDVVELLNDDTEVTPGWADAALTPFADPHIVAIAPLVLQLDPTRPLDLPPLIDSAGDEYDPGGFARKRWHGRDTLAGDACLTPGAVWGVSATAGFYRRSALLAAGSFPEHFGAYFEDVDLSHRLRRLGGVWFEPGSVVWHRVSASYGRRPNRRVLEQQSCNEERVFWRNVRGRELWRNLPRHAAVLTGKAVRRMNEGQFVPWAVGRLRAWCGG
ncbi:MAG: glycosyltransferase [Fimbriiglobus sp.]|jgi:GT2 family glycosyltransferase|nr:glycosyltransferase [Fimbriiglobus sp.]